jgi:hypothetical protein
LIPTSNLKIHCSDQDYFFWSPALGEPFLSDGILHYFDGQTLTLVGYPVVQPPPSSSADDALRKVLTSWVASADVRLINYFGPTPLCLPPSIEVRYALLEADAPDPFNIDVTVALDGHDFLRTRRAKKAIREVERRGLEVNIRRESLLSWRHLDLLRGLVVRKDLDISGAAYALNAQPVLTHPSTLLFEVRSGAAVAGFALAHSYFPEHPFVVAVATDPETLSASDALYLGMLRHYADAGVPRLGLGYAVDAGSLRYKSKWGATVTMPPYYQFVWRRADTCDSYVCFDWRVRLFASALRSDESVDAHEASPSSVTLESS